MAIETVTEKEWAVSSASSIVMLTITSSSCTTAAPASSVRACHDGDAHHIDTNTDGIRVNKLTARRLTNNSNLRRTT